MRILDWLLRRRPDPTAGWPDFRPAALEFDLGHKRFGPLRFGDEVAAAAPLGRPDLCSWSGREDCELTYARGGFELAFEGGRFVYLAFFIGPDKFLPRHPGLRFAEPRLLGWGPAGVCLSRQTDARQLRGQFGPPDGQDEDETILSYTRAGVAIEFELDRAGRLKRCNLSPARPPKREALHDPEGPS
jgi:hypothetical protein